MKGKKWWSLLLAACLLLAFLPASAKDVPCSVCGQIHEGDCPVTAAREKIDGLPAPDEVEAMNREKQEQAKEQMRQAENAFAALNPEQQAMGDWQKFSLLQAYFAAHNVPETIVITQDGTVLDLQGKTVTGPAGAPAVWVCAKNVTICNGIIQGAAGTAEQESGIGIQNDGTNLTLGENLKVYGGSGAPADTVLPAGNGEAAVKNSGSMVLSGAALTGGSGGAETPQQPQKGNGASAAHLQVGSKLELRSGTLTGGSGHTGGAAIQMEAGSSLMGKTARATGGAGSIAGGHAIAVSQGNLEIQDGFYTGGMSSAGTGGNGLAVLSGEESIKLTGGVFSGGAGQTAGNAVSTTGLAAALLGEFSHYQPADGSDAVDAGQPVLPKAVQVKTVLPVAYIGSTPYTSLQQAVQDAGDKAVIELAQDLALDQPLAVSAKALTLTGKDGGSYTVSRKDSYSGSLVSVESGGQLTLKNIILDGGAIWSAETSVLRRQNGGAKSQSPLAVVQSGTLVLDAGAALQNNDNEKAEKPAAGGAMVLEGTLVLTADAAVRDNRAAANAGGVYLDASVLRMEANASVCHNSAVAGSEQSVMSCVGGVQAVAYSQILLGGSARIFENAGTGGGVTLSDRAVLTVSDNGSISGNRAVIGTLAGKAVHTGGGVSAERAESVQVEGAAVIWGNFVEDAAGKRISYNNLLYLEQSETAGAPVSVTGALDAAAKIGVGRYRLTGEMGFLPVSGAAVLFSSEQAALAGKAAFACDDGSFALWQDGAQLYAKPAVSYDLTGKVTRGEKPAAGAKVAFKRGRNVIAAGVVQDDGSYGIETISPGLYQMVVSLADGSLTMTSMVCLTDQTKRWDVVLPQSNTSSVVQVLTDTEWIVGGLDSMFSPDLVGENADSAAGVTQKDLAAAASGGSVILTMTVKGEETACLDCKALTDRLKSKRTFRQELLFDISVQKQTVENKKATAAQVNCLPESVEIHIPIPSSLQGKKDWIAYRLHGGKLQSLTALENRDGEYLEVHSGELILHLRRFSPYAIGWEKSGGAGEQEPDEPQSFEEKQDAFWESVANQIKRAQSGDTITVDAGDFTDMNWRVMSALRNHPGVALKIHWNGGKTFLIPAGKAQPDNGLSYDSLYQLEKLYAEPDGHHNEGLSKPAPSLPAVQPSASSVPPVESSLLLETSSSSSEHVPESLPEIPYDQPDPAQPEEDLFHISAGVILAGAGILTALIVGIWAVASHRRRRREIE